MMYGVSYGQQLGHDTEGGSGEPVLCQGAHVPLCDKRAVVFAFRVRVRCVRVVHRVSIAAAAAVQFAATTTTVAGA